MNVKLAALLLMVMMVCGFCVLPMSNAQDQWTWTQEDPSGDGTVPVATWGDITAIHIRNDVKEICIAMDVAGFTGATGEIMYEVPFLVGEKGYYVGVDVTFAAGQVVTDMANGWTADGTSVTDRYEIDTAGNRITFYATLKSIKAGPGDKLIEVRGRIGNIIPAAGYGQPDFYDTFGPSEVPYVIPGAVPTQANAYIELSSGASVVEIKPGESAAFIVTANNTANVSASATLVANITGNWTIDPASTSITVDANGTQTITYTVTAPTTAQIGDTATITILGGNAPFVITVRAASETNDGGDDGGKTPGFEMFSLLGAIVAAAIVLKRKK